MATATVARTSHATLSTTVVDTINITDLVNEINVRNRSGATDLAVTFATGVGAAAATPVLLAAESLVVPSGNSLTFSLGRERYHTVQVKILGNANAYSVQALR